MKNITGIENQFSKQIFKNQTLFFHILIFIIIILSFSCISSQKSSPADDSELPWADVSAGGWHTAALTTDGSLYTWGDNYSGQLGDGTTTYKNTPTPILIGTGYSAIAAGDSHTAAIKIDGSLYTWGYNFYGQIGDGTKDVKTTPTLIGTGFSKIAAGNSHTIALKINGSLYGWGANFSGQIGNGSAWKITPARIEWN